ncbi:MAG: isoleucine--tRNA ligase [Oscillospiraceae bacterium]|nr:isoleucine--tRNA ligase [Oscillospiraceae bacterium]
MSDNKDLKQDNNTDKPKKKNYNATLNLPDTTFPMRANLPEREPLRLAAWEKNRLYYKLQEVCRERPQYVLHDGPPYANGDIHMGTALNKVLKDIIVKYKTMQGFGAPYVPGWDCHGLPIELKAVKQLNQTDGDKGGTVDVVRLRQECRAFALSCLDSQKAQFKRLGVWGDFDNPYVTIAHDFEARQIEIFHEMYKKGYVYRGLKPVHWCATCKTALAEAEIEYGDDVCYSAFVKFRVTDDKGKFSDVAGLDLAKTYVAIWTTTIWTLPGNLAISLGSEYEYTFIKTPDGEHVLVARELAEKVAEACKIDDYELVGSFKGKDLDLLETAHPFLDRKSVVIVGNHVTLESGTGCVHTAPGFGVEDYEVCNSYKGMFDIIVPVDENGKMTDEAGAFIAGESTDNANKIISKRLEETGLLLGLEKINHSYPHCWRCKNPIIYRATDQWFVAVSKFAPETVKAVEQTQWLPAWGKERMLNMVRDRSDWCISRQRRWGVPIPILYCAECNKEVINDETIAAISQMFREKSADSWYAHTPDEFIPSTVKCTCGCGEFKKELDIFDVWFDSGCTHAAVLEQRDELVSPCDLYLEGADQFRGWFQSSLLTSVAVNGRAPYKSVCAHGWVVDGNGRKMSKSEGNVMLPEDVIKKYGADVLRLWVASLDYHSDIRVSHEMFGQLSEVYRKIRNTARYVLGNLSGFDPNTDSVALDELSELDKWALVKFDALIDKVIAAYEAFDFYLAYHALNNFCVVEMSNFYLDIIKDRLYCEGAKSLSRRSSQTAMYHILSGLTRLIAPILCYTADEIWESLPKRDGDNETSVVFNSMPTLSGVSVNETFNAKWDKIRAVRGEVLPLIEVKRNEKVNGKPLIGKPLEAKVLIKGGEDLTALLPELIEACIVSDFEWQAGGDIPEITVTKHDGEMCERCWIYSYRINDGLCERCAGVVGKNII